MEKFEAICIADIMNRINAKVSTSQVVVITPVGNLISRLDDKGRVSAATMIINGSATARSLFLSDEYRAMPMSEIMEAIDQRVRAEKRHF